jgi:TatD DNase family protein
MGHDTSMQLIDIGINLTHHGYDADRDAVIARALAAGVSQMVITGASLAGTAQAISLAERLPERLAATAGVHPHHATELDAAAAAQLRSMARSPVVVAVGECGLDYFRDYAPRAAQQQAFERQLALAAELKKPVFLHLRDAREDFFAILNSWRPRIAAAVAHCFTDDLATARECLELDLHIGITGWFCDERRGRHLTDVVRAIPAGRLMLETDGPYLLPRDLTPKPASRRNEPCYLPHIARAVAAARGETLDALAEHTTRTARQFFGLAGI